MSEKSKLLSVGEMSKFTGAGIKSLHYYDRLGILKPVYTDPDSKYRYYSLDQAQLVWIIMFCVEHDIPLKDLPEYTDINDTINYRNLLERGEKIARKRLAKLENELQILSEMKRKMDSFDTYQVQRIHSRELTEKNLYLMPCKKSPQDIGQSDIAKMFLDIPYHDDVESSLLECGILYKHSPGGSQYYMFAEFPAHIKNENMRTIPGGIYYCRYSEDKQITQARKIFQKQLAGKSSFVAIETEVITGKHKIGKPINELRVIAI